MKILILNNHTKDLQQLQELFPEALVISKEQFDAGFEISGYDLVIISGATHMPGVFHNPEFYSKEIDFIKNTRIPVIGICLGCELVNYAFGGTLKELESDHQGDVVITVQNNELKQKVGELLTAYEHHRVAISTVAEHFTIEASSDHGPEIIMHTSRRVIGIQFHPEVRHQQNVIDWAIHKLGLV